MFAILPPNSGAIPRSVAQAMKEQTNLIVPATGKVLKVEQMFDIMNTKVALLAGGKSSEREISLASGRGAKKALDEAGFQVTQLDPANAADLKQLIDGGFDVAFLCTHGRGGEDGSLQGFLETIGMPYTGSGVLGSAISMDKTRAKVLYEAAGIPTPPSAVVKKAQWNGSDQELSELTDALGEKCVIKAASEGSSVGVYIEEGAANIARAIEDAFEYDETVLIERYIKGTELTVPVLEDGKSIRTLPIIEIVPKNESYDFESKYAPGGSEHICPARLSDEMTAKIQQWGKEAHIALDCGGVSRTDFILDEEGRAWALETNTLPGMTETSLIPDAARAAGMTFPELCVDLVADALSRR